MVIVDSGRRTRRLLRVETVTYSRLWRRAGAIVSVWHLDLPYRLRPGDVVAIRGSAELDAAVESVLTRVPPETLVVFDMNLGDGEHQAALDSARRLIGIDRAVIVDDCPPCSPAVRRCLLSRCMCLRRMRIR
ncbi:hypothetical protein GZH49_39530 [Nocardia terpenica]|uniref:hypothetical protein n=1 Tax=Nocardia terpenica TaxID=455432 RepID=UPI002FE3B303